MNENYVPLVEEGEVMLMGKNPPFLKSGIVFATSLPGEREDFELVDAASSPRREEIVLGRCNPMQITVKEGKLSSTNIGKKFHLLLP